MQNLLKFGVIGVLIACIATAASAQGNVVKKGENLVEVTVTGQGMDKDEATRDAQRKAVEQGAGTFIYSQSQTKDFALVKDTVLARSAGFVQSFEIISAKPDFDGVWQVKIKAVVSVQGIEDVWGVVTNLLKEMGRPKIMVFINEKIGDEVVEDSTVQTGIENQLLKSGFLLVDKNQIKEIDRKDLVAAVAEDSPARAQAIAKRFGAQIFISGSSHAELGGQKQVAGINLWVAEAEANVKCYRSDTAQLMSAIPGKPTRGTARDVARSAAKKALDDQANQVATAVTNDILRFWMDIMEGRGEVKLIVEGLKFNQYTELKKKLSGIKDITDVSATFANNVAECSLESGLNAEKLAEKIVEALPKLEITDVSQNVIKGKMTE